MTFIKHFNTRGGKIARFGSAILKDGFLRIRIPYTLEVVEKGFIEGGFGLVVRPCESKKSKYTLVQTKLDKSYLPAELCAQNYRFGIPAEQISDTEIVFMYNKAKMLTKK